MTTITNCLEQLARQHSAKTILAGYAAEIERAIDKVKHPRSPRDRWWRRQWYKAAAQRRRRAAGLAVGRRRRVASRAIRSRGESPLRGSSEVRK